MIKYIDPLKSEVNSVNLPVSTPSRICLICRKLEFPNAMMCTEIGWLCPECTDRIKRIIYKEDLTDN